MVQTTSCKQCIHNCKQHFKSGKNFSILTQVITSWWDQLSLQSFIRPCCQVTFWLKRWRPFFDGWAFTWRYWWYFSIIAQHLKHLYTYVLSLDKIFSYSTLWHTKCKLDTFWCLFWKPLAFSIYHRSKFGKIVRGQGTNLPRWVMLAFKHINKSDFLICICQECHLIDLLLHCVILFN